VNARATESVELLKSFGCHRSTKVCRCCGVLDFCNKLLSRSVFTIFCFCCRLMLLRVSAHGSEYLRTHLAEYCIKFLGGALLMPNRVFHSHEQGTFSVCTAKVCDVTNAVAFVSQFWLKTRCLSRFSPIPLAAFTFSRSSLVHANGRALRSACAWSEPCTVWPFIRARKTCPKPATPRCNVGTPARRVCTQTQRAWPRVNKNAFSNHEHGDGRAPSLSMQSSRVATSCARLRGLSSSLLARSAHIRKQTLISAAREQRQRRSEYRQVHTPESSTTQ
jgi:hypothetical protein